ncbi:PAS domain S-box protein [Armatimonas sp.]|uniref:PAS domain S-box protein n=1 Tax=Armatimonas sp. TaxID=1872638 RepID=UPI0037504556
MKALLQQSRYWSDIEEALNVHASVAITDSKGIIIYVNDKFCAVSQYSSEELLAQDHRIINSGYHAKEFMEELWTTIAAGNIWRGELRNRAKDGSFYWENTTIVPLQDSEQVSYHYVSIRTDITEEKAIATRELHNLALVAGGAPLSDVLQAIVQSTEARNPGILCSILLLDSDETHLLLGAAPSLPDTFNDAIQGLPIGPEVGSCGTAAYLGQRVIIEDIQTHPFWEDYRDVASEAGLRACWSEPILSSGGKVLGTFAIYHRQVCAPSETEIATIHAAGTLAAVAIERIQSEQARLKSEHSLREREARLQAIVNHQPECVKVVAPDGTLREMNPAGLQMIGCDSIETMRGQSVFQLVVEDHRVAYQTLHDQVVRGETGTLEFDIVSFTGERRSMETHEVPLYDASGNIEAVLGLTRDITARKQAESDLRTIVSHARCLLWSGTVEDPGDSKLHWDVRFQDEEAAHRFLPVPLIPDQDFTQAWYKARHPEDHVRANQLSYQKLRAGESYSQEFRCYLDDGSLRWIKEDVEVQVLGERLWRVIGVCTDITPQKQIETDFQYLMTGAHCLLWHATVTDGGEDLDWQLDVSNEAAAADFLPVVQVLGQSYTEAWIASRIQEDWPDNDRTSAIAIRSGQDYSQEFRCRRDDGTVVWLKEDVEVATLAPGRWRAVGVCTDITQLKYHEAALQESADHDPLTGLLNHRVFHKRLEEEVARAQRDGSTLAVVMMDLDNFKFFNDVYGHVIGDEVLRLVAQRLREICRAYDAISRFGGDEFALLLPGIEVAALPELEARLRSQLKLSFQPPHQETQIPITVSLGVAIFPPTPLEPFAPVPDWHDAIRLADERLRHAKTGGMRDNAATLTRERAGSTFQGFSMLDALVTAVDNKDRYTKHHSEDVLMYSLQLARLLGLDETALQNVAVAALLHDVGKIGVPDAILRKPGALTYEELGAIQQHPVMGAVIVAAVPGLEETLPAIRHHHERWDGKGYPDGLVGEEIPLVARLMAVADAFSAMTTDRPYRQGMPSSRALEILEEGAAAQWDPEVVRLFLQCQREKASTPRL